MWAGRLEPVSSTCTGCAGLWFSHLSQALPCGQVAIPTLDCCLPGIFQLLRGVTGAWASKVPCLPVTLLSLPAGFSILDTKPQCCLQADGWLPAPCGAVRVQVSQGAG